MNNNFILYRDNRQSVPFSECMTRPTPNTANHVSYMFFINFLSFAISSDAFRLLQQTVSRIWPDFAHWLPHQDCIPYLTWFYTLIAAASRVRYDTWKCESPIITDETPFLWVFWVNILKLNRREHASWFFSILDYHPCLDLFLLLEIIMKLYMILD